MTKVSIIKFELDNGKTAFVDIHNDPQAVSFLNSTVAELVKIVENLANEKEETNANKQI